MIPNILPTKIPISLRFKTQKERRILRIKIFLICFYFIISESFPSCGNKRWENCKKNIEQQ